MEHISAKPGEVYMLPPLSDDTGFEQRLAAASIIGSHQGSMFFTIGERAGQLIDNGLYRKQHNGEDVPAVYVVHKDFERNRLYITDNHDDPHFYSSCIELEEVSLGDERSGLMCQVRYQQKEPVHIKSIEEQGEGTIISTQVPLWAAAPGQSLVFYEEDRVVGGGIIKKVHV